MMNSLVHHTPETHMSKLINAHKANPSDANLAKLAAYLRKHMMALCMADADELAYLRSVGLA